MEIVFSRCTVHGDAEAALLVAGDVVNVEAGAIAQASLDDPVKERRPLILSFRDDWRRRIVRKKNERKGKSGACLIRASIIGALPDSIMAYIKKEGRAITRWTIMRCIKTEGKAITRRRSSSLHDLHYLLSITTIIYFLCWEMT